MAGFETPEEKAAREAREALQQKQGNYVDPSRAAPVTAADMERNKGLRAPGNDKQLFASLSRSKELAHDIAVGNQLPGSFARWGGHDEQDAIHSNLSRGEAEAQLQRDFGFGSGNNAETAAMIGGATATGNKFSNVFGDISGTAAARSDAANARGTGMFAGDTSQYQAGLANAQKSRGMQTGAYEALMGMANAGPGPSAAQAQLTQATDANTQNALAMARSGRGMGGGAAAMRQAIGQNAATQQQAGGQMAELRANENTAFQAQRLQAMQGAGDVGYKTAATDQNYGALGLQGAQYETDAKLKGTQLNDQTAQAWAQQQAAAAAQAHAAEVAAQTQAMNVNAQALAGRQSAEDAAFRRAALERGEVAAAEDRQANLVSAGIGAGATVLGEVSDERLKTNIVPLGGLESVRPGEPLSGNGVKPLQIQPKPPPPPPPPGPSAEEKAAAKGGQLGGTVGKVGGAVIGGAVGGPIGALAGSAIGGLAGKHLGKVFSDVRSKTNIEPLSRSIDETNPYDQLGSLAKKYGAEGVASSPKAVARFADVGPKALSQKAERRFARDESHPILSEGDALLADSARNAPPSAYDYKEPNAPGAKPGRQVGPMAQDLAAHPVTRGAVETDPNTGRLTVDGGRAALAGLAQNHSQQNQLDALGGEIARLESMLKRKPGDSKATSFKRDQTAGGLI